MLGGAHPACPHQLLLDGLRGVDEELQLAGELRRPVQVPRLERRLKLLGARTRCEGERDSPHSIVALRLSICLWLALASLLA